MPTSLNQVVCHFSLSSSVYIKFPEYLILNCLMEVKTENVLYFSRMKWTFLALVLSYLRHVETVKT